MSKTDSAVQASRREFLKTAVTGAAAAAVLPATAIASEQETSKAGRSHVSRFVLDEMSLEQMQNVMQADAMSSRYICELYLSRIREIDKKGPKLNAVIELNPDALTIADQLDRERKAKSVRGPLHGIPVLIKDNIATADRMQTTAGSLAMVSSRPPKDAAVVARLRQAGAVILGKTNLSEWANLRSAHSSSGWSGRGGLTLMPYALDRNPSGSSSGSGVAVAANLCAAAVGTETDGSVVSPAAQSGIVGIKPTVGLVSRAGIIPISHNQDTAGPMGRTVADVATLLSVMAGVDPEDAATKDAGSKIEKDYTRFLDTNGLKGARLGVVRKYAGFSLDVDRVFDEAIAVLKKAGAEIVDPVEIPTIGKFDEQELLVLLYDFKADLNAYFHWLGAGATVKSMKEVIDFNEKNRDTELKYFGQDLMIQAEAKGPLTSEEYVKALEDCRRMSRAEGIDGVMDKLHLDALIAPTQSPAWTTDLVNGDHTVGGCSTMPAVAGYPHITVPMGLVWELPVGISFFGRAWSEGKLISLAYAFEQASKMRRPPRFLPRLPLPGEGA